MTDWRKHAVEEYLATRAALVRRWESLAAQHEAIAADMSDISQRVSAMDEAARIFNLEEGLVDHPLPEQTLFEDDRDDQPKFKDLALALLEEVFPRGLKAAQVRAHIEHRLSRKFHEKTAGMTLYRLSQEGLTKREGHTWYWVPRDQRKSESDVT